MRPKVITFYLKTYAIDESSETKSTHTSMSSQMKTENKQDNNYSKY